LLPNCPCAVLCHDCVDDFYEQMFILEVVLECCNLLVGAYL
jgi:hypothetical protein